MRYVSTFGRKQGICSNHRGRRGLRRVRGEPYAPLQITVLCRVQLRSVRGQLASSSSACAAAEGRNRQLSSQVSAKAAELAQLREEAEKAASDYKAVRLSYLQCVRMAAMLQRLPPRTALREKSHSVQWKPQGA